MENKQGCVDWLVEEINKQKAWADPSRLEPIIEKAKAMHKEEIITTAGYYFHEYNHPKNPLTPTQYYNETFGGNNE